MSRHTLRIDPLPPIPAGLPGDPITGNTGGSSGGGQAGTSLQLSYYLYDHLGNTRMVFHTVLKAGEEDPTYVPEYLADYYPYGKILREWLNCTGERYLTTQHERDIETGYDYRGARFYDSDLGRFLSIDPLAAEYAGWSGYAYVLGNPVGNIDPDGRYVEVKTTEKNGQEHIHIEYRGVLIDRTGTMSRKELRQLRGQIKSQIESSFSGSGDSRSWSTRVKLRIGSAPRGSGSSRESTIQLVNDAYHDDVRQGSSTHLNGFDALINIGSSRGIAKTSAHEVGHTMGLPHVFGATVEGSPKFSFMFPDPEAVDNDNPLAGNLMMPGPFPPRLQGTSILEAQILHIRSDYQSGKLNREDIRGSDTEWGDLGTDIPAFRFIYSPILRKQQLWPR